MGKIKTYSLLHLCILIFSFTGVFAKAAANAFNSGGLINIRFLIFIALMLAVCVIYAFAWQIIIKQIDLNVAYANRSLYLLWGQIWAVSIYGEQISIKNIIGVIIVFIGVLVVVYNTDYKEDSK